MAKLFAGIDTERGTQVTRIGHRELNTFVQTNSCRIEVHATPDSFKIFADKGRYQNDIGKSGLIAEVKEGYIYVSKDLAERVIIR